MTQDEFQAMIESAYLVAERRAARDYVDLAALAEKLGRERALAALGYLNLVYPPTGSQSAISRFAGGGFQ